MFQTFETSGGPEHVGERLALLRALMKRLKVDAVLVPRADEHQGEYVPPCAERLSWLLGFSGSAGLGIVTRDAAALFVDGRYTVQARSETDATLVEVSDLPRNQIEDWIISKLRSGAKVGFDPWLHTAYETARLSSALKSADIKLKALARNPVDVIWGDDRPPSPLAPITLHAEALAGKSAADKISDLQTALKAMGHSACVLTLPETVCWLLNIRGSDVAHNPIVRAFAIVPATGKVELFVDRRKSSKDVRSLLRDVAKFSPPDDFVDKLRTWKASERTVLLDDTNAAHAIKQALGRSAASGKDPCIAPKSIKTAAEIAGAKVAHVRDGAAVVRFLCWLQRALTDRDIDEITAVTELERLRAATGKLREISFPSIAGSGQNGAIVHYRVSHATNRNLANGELFLIDSGGQYEDGTTDITRTVAIGTPSTEMQDRYTRVLQGHIAIATARFPDGTRGIDLDPFARRALWDIGCDYAHGTGHGIGSYLSVHEGPQSISRAGMAALKPGMLISNEPGFYREGAYGIRIENVVLVTLSERGREGAKAMMEFETITLAPMDRQLILADRLSPSDRDWLDAYHARVFATLKPHLDTETRDWLQRATAPL